MEQSRNDARWWIRLAKVVYVALYIPLPFVLIFTWVENSETWNYQLRDTTPTPELATFYAILAFLAYMTIVRLVKLTFLYIVLAEKPKWKNEIKKWY